jgi:transcriptional regulator with XRE-family HTH domain
MTLGERLKSLIEEKSIGQKRFAEIFNLAPTTVSGYITNYRAPNDELKKKFADYFGVTVDYLLGRSDIRIPQKSLIETKAYHNLDTSGLPEEDIKKVEEYVELLKKKYNPNGSLK